MNRWILVGVVALVLATGACRSKPAPAVPAAPLPAQAAAPTPAPPPPPAPAPAPAPPAALSEDDIFARMSLAELNASRPLAEVFFAYDSVDLDATATAALERNAAWMRRWPSTTVRIEGHADERGTAEYNLSLSNRRAVVVRNYLASLGVPDARVTIVALGKEQPVCRDAAESCWQRNRRGNPVIVSK